MIPAELVPGEPGGDTSDSDAAPVGLITVNVAAIAPTLFHAELFGAVKGAFTGANRDRKGLVESAKDKVLFLDEIDKTPVDCQAVLLRFLETRKYRRVGDDLEREINIASIIYAAGSALPSLIPDLFYRLLHAHPIRMPPLKEWEHAVTAGQRGSHLVA